MPTYFRTSLFWVITQRVVPLKIEPIMSRNVGKVYHYSLRNSPEERRSH